MDIMTGDLKDEKPAYTYKNNTSNIINSILQPGQSIIRKPSEFIPEG